MGKSWAQITSRAPWVERDNLNGEVTVEGLIIVAAGFNSREALNDIWISVVKRYTPGNTIDR